MERIKNYLILVAIQLLILNVSGYVITTPRKWSSVETNKVCVTLKSSATAEDHLEVGVKAKDSEDEYLLPMKPFPLVPGELNICGNLALKGELQTSGDLVVEGKLGGVELKYTKHLSIVNGVNAFKTFVQTNKVLYNPLQKVQFRILSVYGPFLNVSTEQYEDIWVENPSRRRIAQWLNVSNEKGLIHKSFQLSEQNEEGTYKIHVSSLNRKLETRTFKVEKYAFPNYEVDIKSPDYILNKYRYFEVEICAKYRSGQLVKGELNLTINNGYGNSELKYIVSPIFGCKKIPINDTHIGKKYPSNGEIKLQVLVKEDDTGIEQISKENIVYVTSSAVTFTILRDGRFVSQRKPGLPYIAEVRASFPGDKPVSHEAFKVCNGAVCKNFTTNADGILKFAFPPHLDSDMEIHALTPDYASNYRLHLPNQHSPSNSSLSIAPEEVILDCAKTSPDIEFKVPIHFYSKGQDKTLVSVQVISRGQIQYSKTFEQAFENGSWANFDESLLLTSLLSPADDHVRGIFTVPIILPKTTSPEAKLIVWYTRDDGEIVADSKILSIAECFSNTVSLSFESNTSHPGEPTGISLRAEPNSLCSLGVADKNADLHSTNSRQLSPKNILDVSKYFSVDLNENSQIDDVAYCDKHRKNDFSESIEKQKENIEVSGNYPHRYPAFPPSIHYPTFPRNNLHPTLLDPRWYPHPHPDFGFPPLYGYYTENIDALDMFNNAGLYVFTNQTVETRPCIKYKRSRWDNWGPYYASSGDRSQAVPPKHSESTIIEVPTYEYTTETYFPETWLWNLIEIGDNGEAEEQLTLPDTVTEWSGSAVCVHPSKGFGLSNKASITTFQDFSVDLVLPASSTVGETLPVKILISNNMKNPIPVRVLFEPSRQYEILRDPENSKSAAVSNSCVSAEDNVFHTIRIKPDVAGKVSITVIVQVDINSIETCGDNNGIFREVVITKSILVDFEGFEKESVQTNQICVKDTIPMVRHIRMSRKLAPPSGIVPGSARGFLAVVGDIMGPTVEDLETLLSSSSFSGLNMLNFASNIFVMKYLESSNQAKTATVKKAVDYIEEGIWYHLGYRQKRGSFSSFGIYSDTGNTRLTAFAVKCFSQAKNYISVRDRDINISMNWLKTQFTFPSDKCFRNSERRRKLKDGFLFKGKDSKFRLTSYVLISLFEAGENSTDPVVRKTLPCLIDGIKSEHPYTLALLSYALTLGGFSDAVKATEKLLSLATTSSSSMYWELPFESNSDDGLRMETAGYAVLALLKLNKKYPNGGYLKHVPDIVRWINANWNAQRGFVPSQETIVVLQALAEYHQEIPQDPIDLHVFIIVNQDQSQFLINESNKLVQKMSPVSKFPADITFDISGTGCVLLQTGVRYNVPNSYIEEFNVTVDIETSAVDSCLANSMKICVSPLREDQVSHNGIIDVKLVSGYIAITPSLKNPISEVQNIQGFDNYGDRLTFYVREFTPQPTCVTFGLFGVGKVEKSIPGTVKVYSLDNPKLFVTEKYELIPFVECLRKMRPQRWEAVIVNVNRTSYGEEKIIPA